MFSAGYDEMQGKGGRKKKDPISAGIKRPGRLMKPDGSKNGSPRENREANYYANVMKRAGC